MQDWDQDTSAATSFLSPIGYENSSCGYCQNKIGSQSQKRQSYYASTDFLTPEFYQSLLDRGWRRSGRTLYKPDLRNSCCPQYTVRLDSHGFHSSKDQRQAQNRFNKFVLGDVYIKDAARLYPLSRDQAKKRSTDFDLVERVHEGEKHFVKSPPEPAHSLVVTLEPDKFTEEKYALFENYQRIVHKEPTHKISRRGFKNFLCNSPLPSSTRTFNGEDRRLGSYHQCYRLDGKLIAIGVLDLLPQCVSAVYFIYDESVHQHSVGKLGALREIALAKEDGYRYWYAGFYIHSCVKMRYKGDYSPQYVLDPESYGWDLFDEEFKKKLEAKGYFSMSRLKAEAGLESSKVQVDHSTNIEPSDSPSSDESASEVHDHDLDATTETPLFTKSMPGVMTRDQLLTDIDLDRIHLRIRNTFGETGNLRSWDKTSIDNPHSIEGVIADLVSAVGPDIAQEMVVALD